MNITRALSISVSCLSLTAGNVFAYSFSGEYLSAPPPSILSSSFFKAASCPSSSNKTCGCGGSGQCKSGNNIYYSSCNCCSSCSGSTSHSGMAYYNSCYNSCTRQTLYTERSCDNSCAGQTRPSCLSGETLLTSSDECGNTCYQCYCRDLACWENCVFTNRTELFADESLSYYYYHCDYFLIDCHGSKILIETDSSIGHTQSTGSDPVTEFCEAY